MSPKTAAAILFSLVFFLFPPSSEAQQSQSGLTSLTSGEILNGFRTESLYLNDGDQPMGARFIHIKTGFVFDLLQIESVPQTFIYVNTFPVSDMGEPHTQEHLLLTKGSKGHSLNTTEGMSMTQSNAFTAQLHTAYHFNTAAGVDVFYRMFEKYLDALLNPDYTDEDVRREVRNWGVAGSADKGLRLQEKGSVYNEMNNSMDNPYSLMYDTIGRMLFGSTHPASMNAGGLPAGIRLMTEKDISRYHEDNYWLGNMGAIVSLPKNQALAGILQKMNAILDSLDQTRKPGSRQMKQLPDPVPAASGAIALIPVPAENAQQQGNMLFAYPAGLKLDVRQNLELSLFLWAFAGDATTNLYKIFVDSKTRLPGMDAQSVYASEDDQVLHPIYIGLDGISPENLTLEKTELARRRIMDELEKIAAYPDSSAELTAFNKRVESSLTSFIRTNSKFMNSPPQFGFRNTGDGWYTQLLILSDEKSFKKSIGFKTELEEIRKRLAMGKNIWKADIAEWKLSSVMPYGVVTVGSPALSEANEKAQQARAAAEVNRLKKIYHLSGDQETIARYKAGYDSTSAAMEKQELTGQRIHFIDNPPLTLDDELQYKNETWYGNTPVFAARFNDMTGATTGIALKLDRVPENKLVYLALFPELLTQTGYILNGKPVSYEEMIQQIQQQILSLESYYSLSQATDRSELLVKASGNNVAEADLSVEWISRVLNQPNWKIENLARLTDLTDQVLSVLRKKMQDREESWVDDPVAAYRNQTRPLFLASVSFLTREHNIFRLKWMLKGPQHKNDSLALGRFITLLAGITATRDSLNGLLDRFHGPEVRLPGAMYKSMADAYNNLSPATKNTAADALMDLKQELHGVPDQSIAADWKALCFTLKQDLAQGPVRTLSELNALRELLLNQHSSRVFLIGSASTENSLKPGIEQLIKGFSGKQIPVVKYAGIKAISKHVQDRLKTSEPIVFAGLINPDSHTGVFFNSAPLISYSDTSREKLIDLLAAGLYSGSGKQSVYSKTLGAGLAYSNGVRPNTVNGFFIYYAERTPELPQTLSFVIQDIKNAPMDTTLLDYCVAMALRGTRAAADYEDRGEAMAVDITEGRYPDMIRRFKKSVLNLSREPGMIETVYQHKNAVYEKILPGYGIPSKEVSGGCFFVIGPEKQMDAYESYLNSVNEDGSRLYRIYPRDYWMVDK